MANIISVEAISTKILLIRGRRVMLDRDLAEIYGVKTKRLNEQVRRNIKRFPADFMFQLTAKEKEEVVAICDHLKTLRLSQGLFLGFCFRALKIFAVRYGLLIASASSLTQGRRAPATRKSLRTPAKNFLMCAPAITLTQSTP